MKDNDKQENLSHQDEELVLDFEDAKNMTVGQAVRKHGEIQAGVTNEDGILDRYIKQHREEIESQKYETKLHLPILEDLEEEQEEVLEAPSEFFEEAVPEEVEESEEAVEAEAILAPLAEEGTDEELADLPAPETASFNDFEEQDSGKKKILIWSLLAVVFVGVLATAFIWTNSSANKATEQTSSTTSKSSSSTEDGDARAFNTLYASFFTDSSQTKLKNSQFDKLKDLKALLDKMDSSSSVYKKAKTKYEQLEKAVQAIQTVNGQFDKPVLVDGELDTTATAKADAAFTSIKTGLDAVDANVTAAINFGRSQQTLASSEAVATPAPAGNAGSSEAPAAEVNTPVAGNGTQVAVGTNPLYGIDIPAGVILQRNLSRVPYDQSKINDSSNEAWNFNPGILEHIIAVSQQRGYITGYNYILERVNIINGNGYYNLFKPDGTYLFSINAKTGYFVGNGAGYADDLDY